MWKNITLTSYIVLIVSSVLGVAFGGLGWPEPTHILLIWVSGLLFAVATTFLLKLVQIHKTDTRIHELEEDNKNLRIARRLDREDLDDLRQKLQSLIKTRFGELDIHSEKEIMDYEAPEAPRPNLIAKIKELPLLKRLL